MSGPTLEQLRAADAWQCAQGQSGSYKNLAKGLPALIMNSGLLQVMAFLEKGGKGSQCDHRVLAEHLRTWLHKQFKSDIPSADFSTFMTSLMSAPPATFQHINAEAMAWLRWVRQMAAAVIEAAADMEKERGNT